MAQSHEEGCHGHGNSVGLKNPGEEHSACANDSENLLYAIGLRSILVIVVAKALEE